MQLSSARMRKLEAWEKEKPEGLRHFTYWYLFSSLSARENNLLLSLQRNGSSLIYPFVFWHFYTVLFESIVNYLLESIFWKY